MTNDKMTVAYTVDNSNPTKPDIYVITPKGELYVKGACVGTNNRYEVFTKIPELQNCKQVVAKNGHVTVLLEDGRVASFSNKNAYKIENTYGFSSDATSDKSKIFYEDFNCKEITLYKHNTSATAVVFTSDDNKSNIRGYVGYVHKFLTPFGLYNNRSDNSHCYTTLDSSKSSKSRIDKIYKMSIPVIFLSNNKIYISSNSLYGVYFYQNNGSVKVPDSDYMDIYTLETKRIIDFFPICCYSNYFGFFYITEDNELYSFGNYTNVVSDGSGGYKRNGGSITQKNLIDTNVKQIEGYTVNSNENIGTGAFEIIYLKNDGTVYKLGDRDVVKPDYFTPVKINGLENVDYFTQNTENTRLYIFITKDNQIIER